MRIDPNEVEIISDRIDPSEVTIPQDIGPHSQAQTRATGWQQTPGKDPGMLTEFLGGAKHAWDRAAYGLAEVLNPNTTGNDSPLFPSTAQRKRELQEGGQFVKETGPASTVGQIAGDVAMSAPVALKVFKGLNAARGLIPAIAGEAAINAGYGALTADEGKGTEGAMWGAGSTLAGHALSSALGAIRQGAKPTADALQFQESINGSTFAGSPPVPKLTPGQLAPEDGWLRKMEHAISSVPFVGAPLRARQGDALRGYQQFSRYAAMPKDEQGRVLDSFVQGFGGGRTIDELTRGFTSAYDDALKGVQITVGRDGITNAPIQKSARELQQLESNLKSEGYRLKKSPSLDSQQAGEKLLAQASDLANLWRPQVATQNMDAAAKLQFIDDAYGRFIPIEAASKKTNATLVKPENYTPAMVLKETRKAKNPQTLYQGSVARQAEPAVGSVLPKTTFGGQLGLGGVGLASVLTGQHLPAAALGGLAAAYGTKPGQAIARGAQKVLTADELAYVLEALRKGTTPAVLSATRDE